MSRVVYATCTNSVVTIYGTIQTKFRGEFCGTMLLQIREYRRLNCRKMSELDDSSDNCWIVIMGDIKAKNSENVLRIEYLERSE